MRRANWSIDLTPFFLSKPLAGWLVVELLCRNFCFNIVQNTTCQGNNKNHSEFVLEGEFCILYYYETMQTGQAL